MGKKIMMTFFLILLAVLFIFNTEVIMTAAKKSLSLCYTSVIPALFPFFVITGVMVNTGAVAVLGKFLSPVSSRVFKISGAGAVNFIIGILCGYPTGAKVTSKLFLQKKITKKEAERLLAFCNNSGPLFVIGAVGTGMLKDVSSGVLLYVIHVISAVITGIVLSVFSKKETLKSACDIGAVRLSDAFLESVRSAVKSILNVCGYVIFFGCLSAVISLYVNNVFLKSLLEVTEGVRGIISSEIPKNRMLVYLSGCLGFGGMCVYFQVKESIKETELSGRCYILGKILQMVLSMGVMQACVR